MSQCESTLNCPVHDVAKMVSDMYARVRLGIFVKGMEKNNVQKRKICHAMFES
jgi:hypothetical protein